MEWIESEPLKNHVKPIENQRFVWRKMEEHYLRSSSSWSSWSSTVHDTQRHIGAQKKIEKNNPGNSGNFTCLSFWGLHSQEWTGHCWPAQLAARKHNSIDVLSWSTGNQTRRNDTSVMFCVFYLELIFDTPMCLCASMLYLYIDTHTHRDSWDVIEPVFGRIVVLPQNTYECAYPAVHTHTHICIYIYMYIYILYLHILLDRTVQTLNLAEHFQGVHVRLHAIVCLCHELVSIYSSSSSSSPGPPSINGEK